jgi:hypothetical protein
LILDRNSKRSDLTDDQVLACGLDHCGGEMLELIDLEHSKEIRGGDKGT